MKIPSHHHHDGGHAPIVAKSSDYAASSETPRHRHPTAQLLYAVRGVMLVTTDQGQWIVPPTRAIWLPIGTWHQVRMLGEVLMRSVYIREDRLTGLPEQCCVVGVSPLLRELILSAMALPLNYVAQGRDGHLVQLLLDEIKMVPMLALSLPEPQSSALQRLCESFRMHPDEEKTLQLWANELAMDLRTLQRRFLKETGLTIGQWRRQSRLLIALEQLAKNEPIGNIAYGLGYSSPNAFATMFKREMGISPSLFYSDNQTE